MEHQKLSNFIVSSVEIRILFGLVDNSVAQEAILYLVFNSISFSDV